MQLMIHAAIGGTKAKMTVSGYSARLLSPRAVAYRSSASGLDNSGRWPDAICWPLKTAQRKVLNQIVAVNRRMAQERRDNEEQRRHYQHREDGASISAVRGRHHRF